MRRTSRPFFRVVLWLAALTGLIFLNLDRGSAGGGPYFYLQIDETRNVIYGSDSEGDKIDIVSLETLEVIDSVAIGDEPKGIDLSPDGNELAVAVKGDSLIVFLDLDTLTINASVTPAGVSGPNNPWDVRYGRPGRLYSSGHPDSSGFDYIHVIDTDTYTEIGKSAYIVRSAPRLAMTPDENYLYATQSTFSPEKIFLFDVIGDTPTLVAEGPHGPMEVTTLAVSEDGLKVYSSEAQVWSADLSTQIGNFGVSGAEILYVPAQGVFYISGSEEDGKTNSIFVYDAETYAPLGEYVFFSETGPAIADASGQNVYVSTGTGIRSLDDAVLPRAFIPLLLRMPSQGIYGYVTFEGSPSTNIAVDLRFFNGSAWSTRASTVTDSNGMYRFLDQPNLQPGQYYYVRYLNTSVYTRLFTWHTASIGSYAGENRHIGDFDIRNINLNTPPSGAVVSLPGAFTWSKRLDSPTDSYEFNLFDVSDGDPYFYTNPPLGFVSNFTLQSLPPGFETNYYYVWNMWAYDGLGGFGISYYSSWVAFSNDGDAASVPLPSAQVIRSEAIELDLPSMWNLADPAP